MTHSTKLLKALVSELERLDSLSDKAFDYEMKTNEDLGILVFAAKNAIESIAYSSIEVPLTGEHHWKVNSIVDRVLAGKGHEATRIHRGKFWTVTRS